MATENVLVLGCARRDEMTSDTHGSNGRFGIWGVIVIAGTVAASVATATWTVARARIADEVQQCEKSKNWNLPEKLEQLGEAAKVVSLATEERKELQVLRNQNERLQGDLISTTKDLEKTRTTLEKQLAEKTTELDEAQRRLKVFEGDAFVLHEGESRPLLGNRLALGLESCYPPPTNSATVNLGKARERLSIGATLVATEDSQAITVTLLGFAADKGCRFAITVKPRRP
jgi:hypothetical protein